MGSITRWYCDFCDKELKEGRTHRYIVTLDIYKAGTYDEIENYLNCDLCKKCFKTKQEAIQDFKFAFSKYVPLK